MTKCYQRTFEFPRVNRRVVEANFDGGEITSDGGVLLLRQADRLLGLSDAIAAALPDARRQASCDHDSKRLLRQRLIEAIRRIALKGTALANAYVGTITSQRNYAKE